MLCPVCITCSASDPAAGVIANFQENRGIRSILKDRQFSAGSEHDRLSSGVQIHSASCGGIVRFDAVFFLACGTLDGAQIAGYERHHGRRSSAMRQTAVLRHSQRKHERKHKRKRKHERKHERECEAARIKDESAFVWKASEFEPQGDCSRFTSL